jgi:hypothetical protein
MPDLDYFWAKDVTGFNPEYHCQRCLKGKTYRNLQKNLLIQSAVLEPFLEPAGYLYLCASWHKDKEYIHFILKEDVDNWNTIKSDANIQGMRICATGAQLIEIDHAKAEKLAREKYPEKDERFWGCWNFQFGVEYFVKSQE